MRAVRSDDTRLPTQYAPTNLFVILGPQSQVIVQVPTQTSEWSRERYGTVHLVARAIITSFPPCTRHIQDGRTRPLVRDRHGPESHLKASERDELFRKEPAEAV
jgi:hypothetical protein